MTGVLKSRHAGLRVEIRALKKGLQIDHIGKIAEAGLINDARSEVTDQSCHDVLAACVQRGVSQRWKRVGIILLVVEKAPSHERAVLVADGLINPDRELILI